MYSTPLLARFGDVVSYTTDEDWIRKITGSNVIRNDYFPNQLTPFPDLVFIDGAPPASRGYNLNKSMSLGVKVIVCHDWEVQEFYAYNLCNVSKYKQYLFDENGKKTIVLSVSELEL